MEKEAETRVSVEIDNAHDSTVHMKNQSENQNVGFFNRNKETWF